MEDKKLNEQESLELIARMIRNSKRNVRENAGGPALIWGYATVLTSLLINACPNVVKTICPASSKRKPFVAIGINTNCKAISTKKNFQEVQKRPKRVEVSFIII